MFGAIASLSTSSVVDLTSKTRAINVSCMLEVRESVADIVHQRLYEDASTRLVSVWDPAMPQLRR